jgi:hypothetical protein
MCDNLIADKRMRELCLFRKPPNGEVAEVRSERQLRIERLSGRAGDACRHGDPDL